MDRIRFEDYKGKKVLIEDFSQMRPGPEFLAQIATAQKVIASQPQKSVLAVLDATGASFNNEILAAMKDFTKANTPYVKAAAVTGINGLLQVALSSISKFSGRSFNAFPTREAALDWLVQQ